MSRWLLKSVGRGTEQRRELIMPQSIPETSTEDIGKGNEGLSASEGFMAVVVSVTHADKAA
jgi:hypothetical protein